jgi:hypothetical protein
VLIVFVKSLNLPTCKFATNCHNITSISCHWHTLTADSYISYWNFVFACWILSEISKSMVASDTGEIDAILVLLVVAWLLITTPPQSLPTFFKKAGQMTNFDSIGRYWYWPRLLESLMHLLTLLITSYIILQNLNTTALILIHLHPNLGGTCQ